MDQDRAARRVCELSIDSELATRAERLGLDLAEVLEAALTERLASERQRWLEVNAEAIAAYNRSVAEGTILSDLERPF
jgi:post-segregation antitoxin (ccd killing protein)